MKLTYSYLVIIALAFLYSCEPATTSKSKDETIKSDLSEIENGLGNRIQLDSNHVTSSIVDQIEKHKIPGVSIAAIVDGKLAWAKAYGSSNADSITTETLFQAASISKPISALAILKLCEEGKIHLDSNVNTYLTSWQVPTNDFTKNNKVTVRQLLNHSAGISVHGFSGYESDTALPNTKEILNGEGNSDAIQVILTPGKDWKYSGGGYTILQLLIEDVTLQPFEEYMSENILLPLGMKNSTFSQPIDTNYHTKISAAFDSNGEMIDGKWHTYPEKSAAGLWTTPTDLAKYCLEIQEIVSGKKNGILKPTTVSSMLTPHKNNWGLGPALFSKEASLRFGHGGKNAGFTNKFTAFVENSNALVIMTNGDNGNLIIDEIERSVSNYYQWEINDFKFVNPVELTANSLNDLTGNFIYTEGRESINVEISIENNTLILTDTFFNIKTELFPLNEYEFVSISNQLDVKFEKDSSDSITYFILDNQWKHMKVKE